MSEEKTVNKGRWWMSEEKTVDTGRCWTPRQQHEYTDTQTAARVHRHPDSSTSTLTPRQQHEYTDTQTAA